MSKTILFVDDEPMYRKLYGEALERAGFLLMYAKNGEEAIAHIEEHRPDLMIVDCVMPVMSGIAFLRHVKRRKIPSIVLTTLEGDTDREDSLAVGAKAFCNKSDTDPDELVEKVKELFGAA